jgi:hypothetical protein
MSRPPLAPLLLGLAGLLPFVWGAGTILWPALADWSLDVLGRRLTGRTLLLLYGTIILSFMSGVVWGFAARATGRHAAVLYALSTLPALWALFLGHSAGLLAAGFLALLLLDRHAQRARLAPPWWVTLRLILTAGAIACLLLGLP